MKVSTGWPCCVRLNIHTNHVANLVLIWPCFNKTTTLQRNQVLWRYFISLTNLYCYLLFHFAKGLKGYCILFLYSASHCHLFLLSGYAFQPNISCVFFLLHEDFKIFLGKTFIFIKVFIKRLNYNYKDTVIKLGRHKNPWPVHKLLPWQHSLGMLNISTQTLPILKLFIVMKCGRGICSLIIIQNKHSTVSSFFFHEYG